MNYWLDLFTGNTWREFQKAGATVTGFRESNWQRARNVKPGDTFLCYMVGVSRWVGILEVVGERYRDESRMFAEELFPVRFRVRPVAMLTPEQGVPMQSLEGRISFFPRKANPNQWAGHVRNSPTKYAPTDGEVIAQAIRQAAEKPVLRPVDKRKLERSSNLYKVRVKAGDKEIERVVSIPASEDEEGAEGRVEPGAPTHTEMQWRLLDLGSQMGLEVWAPRRDRTKSWESKRIADIKGLRDRLPAQFDMDTNRTIEQIDVLWLDGQTIVAAFEVEHTTSIFSGLLRMSDLLTMQPNITIKLYIVGPDERQAKFESEVARPTFAARPRPLHDLCRFLPYSRLCARLDEAKNVIRFLKPEFLDEIAELYQPEAEVHQD
jgi:predicted RNA-binding protein